MPTQQNGSEKVYDWASYYETLLNQVKKENIDTVLMIEEYRKQAEMLQDTYGFIKNNPLWKLLSPARAVCDRIDEIRRLKDCSTEDIIASYKNEIFLLKHSYQAWIEQIEKTRRESLQVTEEQMLSVRYICMDEASFAGLGGNAEIDEDTVYVYTRKNGIVDKDADRIISAFFIENPKVLFSYADEDYLITEKDGTHRRVLPWFKPGWSPETLLSFFYFDSFGIIRGSLLKELLPQIISTNPEEAVYELFLRAAFGVKDEAAAPIREVLFHRYTEDFSEEILAGVSSNPNWDELQRLEKAMRDRLEKEMILPGCSADFNHMKERVLQENGIKAHMEAAMDPDCYHVVYEVGEPKVSAVVLSKDHPDVLELCLESLAKRTDYSNLEIIVVDNGSTEENKKKIEKLKNKFTFNYLYTPMEFNFSAQCNIGAKAAIGEVILLLNDDVEVVQKDWLKRMVGQAMQPQVGAVGAKLLYAGTNRIQHAGITNLKVGPSHKLITFTDDRNYYYGRNRVTYNMLGVTAACLVIDAKKYKELGGLDESMKVAYNDVDFCFRLHEAGYRNILRNDALLYHYESLSRGLDVMDDAKWLRLQEEKKQLYEKHDLLFGVDPYYHPDLIDNSSDYFCNFKSDGEIITKYASLQKISGGKLAKASVGKIKLSVDHAGLTPRDHALQLDDYWVSGWSFLPGADQCKYGKRLLFKNEKNEIWEGLYFVQYRKDVEEMFFSEKNISGAGFSLRLVKDSLKNGSYHVGMLYEDLETGKRFVTWSDKTLQIV